jgi:hypothetical protein
MASVRLQKLYYLFLLVTNRGNWAIDRGFGELEALTPCRTPGRNLHSIFSVGVFASAAFFLFIIGTEKHTKSHRPSHNSVRSRISMIYFRSIFADTNRLYIAP